MFSATHGAVSRKGWVKRAEAESPKPKKAKKSKKEIVEDEPIVDELKVEESEEAGVDSKEE